ncbi:hypothetical protein [Jannaschia ovalis]|uniref:Uncharacterized protein n=1 Tax=Jannaschia ovalis TaxID=3038773 RepID=A0ABY8LFJ3_9RHOB|nr:hypothetical protein [Jannaschia sp. GRR-S6-38]WGH80074.1 hypothetical protein P8627_07370 [Jannaschia sp. GRR-S6-38]
MRAGWLAISALALAGCNTVSAVDFVGEDVAVTPGLASCATAIGRPDLARDPQADMSAAEIEALVACTAERASR